MSSTVFTIYLFIYLFIFFHFLQQRIKHPVALSFLELIIFFYHWRNITYLARFAQANLASKNEIADIVKKRKEISTSNQKNLVKKILQIKQNMYWLKMN